MSGPFGYSGKKLRAQVLIGRIGWQQEFVEASCGAWKNIGPVELEKKRETLYIRQLPGVTHSMDLEGLNARAAL